jgi:hypothetical protein
VQVRHVGREYDALGVSMTRWAQVRRVGRGYDALGASQTHSEQVRCTGSGLNVRRKLNGYE